MTNCKACGVPLAEEDAFCPNCGAATGKPRIQAPKTVMDIQPDPAWQSTATMQPMMQQPLPAQQQTMPQQSVPVDWRQQAAIRDKAQNKNFAIAIKIVLVLACIIGATYYLVPLLWCVPMTIVAWRKLDREEPLGTAFKVCTCIFVSRVAGFLMFMMKDEKPTYIQY